MSKNVDSKAVTVSVKIYECLLAAYPAAFRRKYGPEMKQVFHDQCRDAWREASAWGVARLWLRVLPDWAQTSVVENSVEMKPRVAFLRLFVVSLAAVLVCSALVAYWSRGFYSSTAQIETRCNAPTGADPYFLPMQFAVIKSQDVLTNVIADLSLDRTLALQDGLSPWTLGETFHRLEKVVALKRTRGTSMIEITVSNPDPYLAAKIANAISRSYRKAATTNATVLDRNAARALLHSNMHSKLEIFGKWALAGTVFALFAAGASAWVHLLIQRLSRHQCRQ